MRLLSIDESQLVVLLNVARAEGPPPWRTVIEEVQKEFDFAELPQDDIQQQGIRFGKGAFKGIALDSLSIHDDGVVLLSRTSTDFLEEAYAHLIELGTEKFGFELVKTHKIDKFFRSSLTVQTEKEILNVFRGADKVRKSLESALRADTGIEAKYLPSGVTFSGDPQKQVVKPTPFRVERKAGADFDFGQYFSQAPLTTQSHLQVLEDMERLASEIA